MSDKELNNRQMFIIQECIIGQSYSLNEIREKLLAKEISPAIATLRRDLAQLCKLNIFELVGRKKTARYQVSNKGIFLAPIDSKKYCQIELDVRPGNKNFNFELFESIGNSIFSNGEIEKLTAATKKFITNGQDVSKNLARKELERFVIELSWKSSKIEGNTYTLLDTERLLRDGIEAEGRSKEEKIMILNHKRAFDFILHNTEDYLKININSISNIHRLLVEDLEITYGIRTKPVGITGSCYRPLSIQTQLQEVLNNLCTTINRQIDPYSKALLALMGIAYIQPFEDGNKRTSRLTANALLLANNCSPLSYRSIDEIAYREAVLVFYEKNSIYQIKEMFIEQYLFAAESYLKFS